MATSKNYSIADDTLNGKVDAEKLIDEIRGSEIKVALASVPMFGDTATPTFKAELDAPDETELDSVMSSHDGIAYEERVQKVQTHIGANKIALLEFGYNFVATKDSTTDNDLLLPVKYIRGAWVECLLHSFGDSMTVQIVDADNVLGAGAGYVVNEFGKNVQIPSNGIFQVLSEAISKPIPSGLYFRVKYTSTGVGADVQVKVNCRGYNDA